MCIYDILEFKLLGKIPLDCVGIQTQDEMVAIPQPYH